MGHIINIFAFFTGFLTILPLSATPVRLISDASLAEGLSTISTVSAPVQLEQVAVEENNARTPSTSENATWTVAQTFNSSTSSTSSNSSASANSSQTQLFTSSTSQATSIQPSTSYSVNSITIAGHTLEVFSSDDPKINAGTRVGLYGKLLYGHNYSSVFGPIVNLPAGSTFSVKLNGTSKNYQIVKTITLEKSEVQNYMTALKNGQYRGKTYSYILMTCAGQNLGDGDATHRTLVFADAV